MLCDDVLQLQLQQIYYYDYGTRIFLGEVLLLYHHASDKRQVLCTIQSQRHVGLVTLGRGRMPRRRRRPPPRLVVCPSDR